MDKITDIASKYNLAVVEDTAHSIDSYYKDKILGSLGIFSAFSFHETKNIISGEGGLLAVNDEKYIKRAEIIREKGTNRSAFFRGEIDKYRWVDIGSSYLPSEIISAFLYAQLENIEKIQKKRIKLWNTYNTLLKALAEKELISLPYIPDYATVNGHLYYILCSNLKTRTKLINYLKKYNILSVFHYLPLHLSPFFKNKHDGRKLSNAVKFANRLLRLPLYYELSETDVIYITNKINDFYKSYKV